MSTIYLKLYKNSSNLLCASVIKKGGRNVSNIDSGREAIKRFMKENSITVVNLATAYGCSRNWVTRVLNGKEKGSAANLLILEIIRDYKIN